MENSFGIPVDHFIVINFRGVRELVDAIGGVDLYVDKRLKYDDFSGKLHIDFQPGQHHMNGEQAEAFLRFRHDALSDIGRIRRQQQFIVAVTNKLKEPGVVTRIPDLVKLADKYVDTDMSWGELLALAWFGKDVNMQDVRTATLPGRPGGRTVSYWIIEPDSAQKTLDRLILDNPGVPDDVGGTEPREIKVGLYYDPGLKEQVPALEATLAQNGFKVVCKNAQSKNNTQIVEHTARTTDALTTKLRGLDAHMSRARLIFAPVGTTYESNACSASEDYTVILGGDSL